MTLQVGLIVLSIIFFVWDAFNTRVSVKLFSLGVACLVGAFLAGRI